MAVGVRSSSSTDSFSPPRCPSREPVREYGRGVCDADDAVEVVRVVEEARKLGVLLGVMPGRVPRVLCEKLLRAGVGARFGGGLRRGDSGRGSEGRLGLKLGLEGRTPGPTVWENLCAGMDGVGGVPCARLPLTVLYVGVLGDALLA